MKKKGLVMSMTVLIILTFFIIFVSLLIYAAATGRIGGILGTITDYWG